MTGRPRIVLDALLVDERPTGVGRSILELTAALAARDRGLDFLVLSRGAAALRPLAACPGWEVRVLAQAGRGTLVKALLTQWTLPRLCRRLGADLLHSLQFVAPARLPCKSVVTVHDLAWLDFPETLEGTRRRYYSLMVPRSLGRADAIVVNSAATGQDVARHYPALAAKVRPTPFATPSWAWAGRSPGRPAAEPRRPAGGIDYFVFVGTLEPRKNLVRLLAAYQLFLDRCGREGRPRERIPQLWLVGAEGWRDGPIQAACRRLQAGGMVRMLPYCPPQELGGLYRGARGLLFPSLHEGFGFPILEAMALGCPVLTSRRGAMLEVAGRCAVLVSPDSAEDIAEGIFRLAWDEQLGENLRAAGYLHAATYSWDRTADQTVAVYEELLAGRSSGKDCTPGNHAIT